MDYKILIVDDEPDIVSMLTSFFAGNGYQVLTAHSGMESLRRVEQNPVILRNFVFEYSAIVSYFMPLFYHCTLFSQDVY